MPAPPSRALSHAILIGTSDFEHAERLPNLPAVRQNLTELLDTLTNADTGILDWDQCVLIDTPDSPATFISRLRSAANQAEDLLLVYYAGHGVRHDKRDDLYLTVRQTDPEGLDGTGVPFGWVREAIEHSPARTRLLILDCCFSGMALGSMSSGGIDVRDVQISGTCVITSSPRNKISHSPPGERLTAFTGELISLLEHGSRLPGEPLTVQALYRGLVAAMANRGLPEPKMKAGDLSADLLLRRLPIEPQPPMPQPVKPQPQKSAPPPPPPPRMDQPSLGSEPAPPPTTDATPSPPARKPMAAAIGSLLLWITIALLLDFTIGGLIGFIFRRQSIDLGVGIGGAVITAIILGLRIWSTRKSRRGGRAMIIGDLLDTLKGTLFRLPPWALAIPTLIFLPFFILGFFVSPDTPDSGSNLAAAVWGVLWFGQLMAACVWGILRKIKVNL